MSLVLPAAIAIAKSLFSAANTAAGIFKNRRRQGQFNQQLVTRVGQALIAPAAATAVEQVNRDRRDTIRALMQDAGCVRSRAALVSKFTIVMPIVEEARISARNGARASEEADLSMLAAALYVGIGEDGWSAARRVRDAESAFQRAQRSLPPSPTSNFMRVMWMVENDPIISLDAPPPGRTITVLPLSSVFMDLGSALYLALPSEF
ncbi:hypothetical protein OG241_22605 [Streptomyces sp. NBC_01390]|uniref:hypothetical protein n=1 Tax=Streptomyces sp. NBC_01390 TaxID=2903850 RepID=UPI003254625F